MIYYHQICCAPSSTEGIIDYIRYQQQYMPTNTNQWRVVIPTPAGCLDLGIEGRINTIFSGNIEGEATFLFIEREDVLEYIQNNWPDINELYLYDRREILSLNPVTITEVQYENRDNFQRTPWPHCTIKFQSSNAFWRRNSRFTP